MNLAPVRTEHAHARGEAGLEALDCFSGRDRAISSFAGSCGSSSRRACSAPETGRVFGSNKPIWTSG
jgi:hypothetical protein